MIIPCLLEEISSASKPVLCLATFFPPSHPSIDKKPDCFRKADIEALHKDHFSGVWSTVLASCRISTGLGVATFGLCYCLCLDFFYLSILLSGVLL
jgi:hypothetical protein